MRFIGTGYTARRHRNHYLRLSACQVDRRPIDLLKGRFGGSIGLVLKAKRQNAYTWTVQNNKAFHALKVLLPYLTVKAEQARLGIEFQRQRVARNSKAPLNPWELAERESYYLAMRDLKKVISA